MENPIRPKIAPDAPAYVEVFFIDSQTAKTIASN